MIILKRPIITEKSMKLAQNNFYTFEVERSATKLMVAKKVTEKFNVKVLKVKIMNVKSHTQQQKKVRKNFRTQAYKKAVVQLSKGERIALFETPKEEVTVTTAEGEPIRIKEKKDLLGRTKVKVEKGAVGASPTTQRKVITGK